MSNFDASDALYGAIKTVISDQAKDLPFITCKVGIILNDLGGGKFRVIVNNTASTAISVCNIPLTVGVTVFILSSPIGDYIVGNYANNINLSRFVEYFPIKEWTNPLQSQTSVVFQTDIGDISFQLNELIIKYSIPSDVSLASNTPKSGRVLTQEGLIAPFSYEIRSDKDVYGRLHFVLDDKWSYNGTRIRSDMTNSFSESIPYYPESGAVGYATKVIISFDDGIPNGMTVKLLGKQGGLTI